MRSGRSLRLPVSKQLSVGLEHCHASSSKEAMPRAREMRH